MCIVSQVLQGHEYDHEKQASNAYNNEIHVYVGSQEHNTRIRHNIGQ